MQVMQVSITVNGEEYTTEIEPRLLLVHFLREVLGLTGTHIGCDTTSCGACTVHLDNVPIKACTIFAVQADGRDVLTVEGLGLASELHPIQEGFTEEHGLQCGFCTPGMMLTARALLDRNPAPTDDEIRVAISGQICRCTGYKNIIASIRWAAEHSEEVTA